MPATSETIMAPHRYTSILFDLYGAFVRQLGGWIAVADLIAAAEPLGVDDQAVRTSVSRFSRKGLLHREVRAGQVGYALSDHARDILAEGDLRIFDRMEPAQVADGWVLATFSVPEGLRAERHQLRTRLIWLGFGNLGSGVWIAPRRVLDRTVETIRGEGLDGYVDVFGATYEAFGDASSLVDRCWDLPTLAQVYEDFLARFGPVAARWEGVDPGERPREAFVDYVTALHEWRKTPYLDPGLPHELLPAPWPGIAAAELFESFQQHLEPAAREYVEARVRGDAARRTPC